MKTIKCYRWVTDKMKSENGQMSWKIGKWKKVGGELKLCSNGLHAYTDIFDSMQNVFGNRWFVAEARGKMLKDETKICCSEMRLNKEISSMIWKRFALFCAKDCLKHYTKAYPNDTRVSDCIKATEDYLDGKIMKKELEAAESAAESAAWSAWSAAGSAWSAAWSAAGSAWSAARSAAGSAWSAARSAAWSAAKSAAWSAAGSAAWRRQKKELLRLIKEYAK